MSQVLARRPLGDEVIAKLGVIQASGESLLAILNSILDLSKIEAGQVEIEASEFALDDLLHAACEAFASLAALKGVDFMIEVAPDTPARWLGDALRVRQVLSNLVSNAVKFTDAGGVTVSARATAAGLALEVTDTGVGIPAERLDSVFQKFTQADTSATRRFGGSGLGLAICYELTALMGGVLAARSVEGRGSTFACELPLAAVTQTAAPQIEGPSKAADRPLRILAAEDNETNQLILKALLEVLGAELTIVGDGVLAIEAFERLAFDLVLMDIQMPRMSGVEAALAIRAFEQRRGRARTPILAVTANVMSHQISEYHAAGIDGVAAKPVQLPQLIAEIERVLSVCQAGDSPQTGTPTTAVA
jgi:CheY-like chemotaxis protein